MADTSNKGLASADEETRERVAHEGGEARKDEGAGYSAIGQKGGHAHNLTNDERSEGGSESGGNFKNDPQRASEAGKKGGSK